MDISQYDRKIVYNNSQEKEETPLTIQEVYPTNESIIKRLELTPSDIDEMMESLSRPKIWLSCESYYHQWFYEDLINYFGNKLGLLT